MTALQSATTFTALVGTPQQVWSQLEQSRAAQVIALPVQMADARHADLLGETLGSVATLIELKLREHDTQTFNTLVNAVLPKAPPSPNLIREATMAGRIRKSVLHAGCAVQRRCQSQPQRPFSDQSGVDPAYVIEYAGQRGSIQI